LPALHGAFGLASMEARAIHRRPLTRAWRGVRGRGYRSVTRIIRRAALRRSRYERDESDPPVVQQRNPDASTCEGAWGSSHARVARTRVPGAGARWPERVTGESRGAGRRRAKRTATADGWATLAIGALRLLGTAERAQPIRWLQRMSPFRWRRRVAYQPHSHDNQAVPLGALTPRYPLFTGAAACALRRRRCEHCREAPGVWCCSLLPPPLRAPGLRGWVRLCCCPY